VPLADVVLQALSEHVAAFPAALTDDARGRSVELLFADDRGNPLGRTWFHRRVWTPAVRSGCRSARTSTCYGTSTRPC
jgi:hypothetical protein